MTYHPIIGIMIFLITIIIAFFLGKNAFKKYKGAEKKLVIRELESKNKNSYQRPPKGDITSPDAPWLKD